MNYPRVLCIGEMLFDYLASQPTKSLAEVESWLAYPGGAPANVACALAKLGTTTGLISSIGKDAEGQKLLDLLQVNGINSLGVQIHETAPTRKVYVLRTESGDRQFASFGSFNDPGIFADAHLAANLLPDELFVYADFLVLGTLSLAYPVSRAAIATAIEIAEQHYIKILVDVNWRPMFWDSENNARSLINQLLQDADFLKVSEEEAQWLFNTTDPGIIARQLDNLEGVMVTKGDRGCAYCFGEHINTVPGFTVPVVDTTGAGDSFVAGFVHLLSQHGIKSLSDPLMIKEIITYANAVAALTVTQLGAIDSQPRAIEVERFLYQNR